MKNRKFILILILEAVLGIIAALAFSPPDGNAYLVIAQFPLAQLGALLRSLSLSGALGNVTAFVLYIALCVVPLVFVALHIKKQAFKAEDWLLVVMSGFSFYMMYMMINPAYLARIPCYISGDVGKAVLGGAFYSLLIGYLVLRLMRSAGSTGTDSLLKVLRLLFAVIAVVLVLSISYIGVSGVRTDLAAIQSGNTDPSVSLGATNFFVLLRYALTQAPVVMELAIFLLGMRLCDHLRADRYGEEAVNAANKLAAFAKKTVAVILLCCIALNLAQILFAGSLVSVDFLTLLPLDAIAVALSALLLTRFFVASRELKRDNQMII
jgi:hypothetical protein